ncbi:MAG: ABC transporter permease subunit [Anaerolineae bacterium]|nr:ABC transporter permease subunit [Anaerolineae bacterium]
MTLSAFYMARLIRLVRSSLLEELRQEYITTARSKGLRQKRVVFVHAFRNTLIPVMAFVTLDLSFWWGGP